MYDVKTKQATKIQDRGNPSLSYKADQVLPALFHFLNDPPLVEIMKRGTHG
jgi:hypothetical protein